MEFLKLKDENEKESNHEINSSNKSILSSLSTNLKTIKNIMYNSSDLQIHEFSFGEERKANGALIYLNNMADRDFVQKNVLQPLMYDAIHLVKKRLLI